jgi:hypothetical protein
MSLFANSALPLREFCSMFVLMVADLLPILSDAAPGLAHRAEFGDRFRYWRGRSGARYLFSKVPFEALVDFRRAAAVMAEPVTDGGFLAWSAAIIDSTGRLDSLDPAWPTSVPAGSVVFVHFLAESDAELEALLGDLFSPEPVGELRLAA